VKSGDDIRRLLEESDRLWNSGDRAGFLALWNEAVPGDTTLEMPVGTEPRQGFDACRRAVWDEFQPTTRRHTKHLIVCGNEAAVLVENVISAPSGTSSVLSIGTYRFTEDGSCFERGYVEFDGASGATDDR